ncbi:MAG: rhomboid family intramembrane serine protease [Flavobacteriales bacterium]|jgi:membrane associated rhomboid family serine protease|nr:rhomboid family intramembrane serine protease [Flavobacteriales bacterium]
MALSFYVLLLIAANVLISRKGFQDSSFFNKYLFQIAAVNQGQYYRLISSSFLHADTTHLLFNMMTLVFFGDYVVSYFGGYAFWLLYFGSVFSGSVLGMYFNRSKPSYSAVGASGGVIGVLFSALLAFPEMKVGFLFIPIPMPGYLFVLLYLGYTLYGMKSQRDQIGHSAHLGGAVGGILLSLMFSPQLLEDWLQYLPF